MRGPGDRAHRSASAPSRAMLPQTLPLQPCARLGAQADQTSRSPGQSGLRELRAVGWQEESPSPQSPLCPARTGSSPMTATEEDTPWPPMKSKPPPPRPCPVHCGRKPRPGGRSPSRARLAGRPGCGGLGRGRVWAQRHGGGWRGGRWTVAPGLPIPPRQACAVARRPPPPAPWEALAFPRPREVRTPAQPRDKTVYFRLSLHSGPGFQGWAGQARTCQRPQCPRPPC